MATHSRTLAWKIPCSPWGRSESDTTERLHFHFSLSCIGEGNGNPLQCSCLENPRDGGAWWAAVYGVSQSRTRLKRLSSSSSSVFRKYFFEYIFHPLSLLQDSNYPNINSSVIVPQICEALFILFLLISFFLFYLAYINTVDLPSSLVSIL